MLAREYTIQLQCTLSIILANALSVVFSSSVRMSQTRINPRVLLPLLLHLEPDALLPELLHLRPEGLRHNPGRLLRGRVDIFACSLDTLRCSAGILSAVRLDMYAP